MPYIPFYCATHPTTVSEAVRNGGKIYWIDEPLGASAYSLSPVVYLLYLFIVDRENPDALHGREEDSERD